MRRLLAALWAAGVLVGCSGHKSKGDDWRTARSSYAPAYVGEADQDFHLRFMIADREGGICELFDGDHEALSLSYLTLHLNAHASGVYEIGSDEGSTEVARVEVESGRTVTRLRAVSGSVELTLTDGVGSAGRLSIRADFPAHPVREIECNGEQAIGGDAKTECECEAEDGSRFTCLKTSTTTCCQPDDRETVPVSVDVDVEYCDAMCSQVAGLSLCAAKR